MPPGNDGRLGRTFLRCRQRVVWNISSSFCSRYCFGGVDRLGVERKRILTRLSAC
ncbi:hypothetical protein BDQ94DRAFT_141132 [Aspergillus welwitschiae]|uniref:Uncharacterized protein n=1 Tax=Aspergillus welwitschiae TaxID=1341132 RepID=A0A3F3Q832_9EURO|nr:hypothetical protein BDQ94DRAFT_141132 [Aspergillus welwitschiae]RDH34916.1 hypothetical protein BDQ94DRAFT_141132 [Aspergillus welwitschiae]